MLCSTGLSVCVDTGGSVLSWFMYNGLHFAVLRGGIIYVIDRNSRGKDCQTYQLWSPGMTEGDVCGAFVEMALVVYR